MRHGERGRIVCYKPVDVVVKIADHSETSDNMGQGMAEQAPRNVANGVKKLFDL